jgi:uncharacterized membrane protein
MGNNDRNTRERKRAKFAESSGQRRLLLVFIGVGVVLLVAAALLLPRLGTRGQAAQNPGNSQAASTAVEVVGQGDGVRLSLSTFDDGQARFYTYQAGDGTTIRFFAVKSSDGVLRTAFDACDVCYPAHKGFHQEGAEMVCNNCGRRFPIAMVGQVSGGCNPAPLAAATDGSDVVIEANSVLAGVGYFQ